VLNWVRHVLFFLNAFNQSLLLLCTVARNDLEPPQFDPESQYFIPLFDKISWICGQTTTRRWHIEWRVQEVRTHHGFAHEQDTWLLPASSAAQAKLLFDPAWRHFRWKEPRLGALPTLVLSPTLKKRWGPAFLSLHTFWKAALGGGFGSLLFPSTSHYIGQILIELYIKQLWIW